MFVQKKFSAHAITQLTQSQELNYFVRVNYSDSEFSKSKDLRPGIPSVIDALAVQST